MVAHCLFEQSGTFKNAFKRLGVTAYDYDIQNEFGETDKVVDLFAEIEGGIKGNLVYSTICRKMMSLCLSSLAHDLKL